VNRLLVVADGTEHAAARDVLERVLTNDRADVPAVVQRRNLALHVPRVRAEDSVAAARRVLDKARREAEPLLEPLRAAEAEVRAAEQAVREGKRAIGETPRWRRRGMASLLRDASDALDAALAKVEVLERDAAPHTVRIDAAEETLRRAEHEASVARISDRLDRLSLEPPSRTIERGVGIEPPGLGL
jgi:hypothetical protein